MSTAFQCSAEWFCAKGRPIASVKIPLIFSFSIGAVSLLLGCGSADGSCAGAHTAWACMVALDCGISICTAAPRHYQKNLNKITFQPWVQKGKIMEM